MVDIIRLLCFLFFLLSFLTMSTPLDTLALNQSIRGSETLVSAGGTFEVGFFSPGNTTRSYLGVWYKNLSPLTVVWVANRETPVQNNSGVLQLNENGVLVILDGRNIPVWSSNISSKPVSNPISRIMDSGNFVLKNGQGTKEDDFLWQSFDHPCDILLPGMKLGWDLVSGLDRFVSSWKSADDPSKGEYSVKVDLRGYPQLLILKGSGIKFRMGSWNGLAVTGYPTQQFKRKQRFEFVVNEKEVYHRYEVLDSSVVSIYMLTPSGFLQGLAWTRKTGNRKVITTGGEDTCDYFASCGANSICNMDGNVPKCDCLKGYVPVFPEQWNISYWSNGCVPRNKSNCKSHTADGFWKYKDMKLPDTSLSRFYKTMNLEECQKSCLENCSCTAYANLDVRKGGSGCLLWFNNLIDMRKFNNWGQDLYIRIPASEIVNGQRNKKKLVAITVGVIIFGLISCVSIMIVRKRGVAKAYNVAPFQWRPGYSRLSLDGMDLPIFDLSIIAKATDNFSSRNKLGEGGFGPVYKGTLVDGQEVAIKRHSKMSDQGLEEFKNEVVLIAKLQHRNLAKLLGCCLC